MQYANKLQLIKAIFIFDYLALEITSFARLISGQYCHNPNDNTTRHNLNTVVG